MARHYYYQVDYCCDCEVCGKRFSGVMQRGPLEYGSDILSTGLNQTVAAADMSLSRKLIQNAIDGTGNQPYSVTNDAACPFCGARQSWYPVREPKKATGIGCLILMAIMGACLGLLIWVIFLFDYDLAGIICLLLGIAAAVIPMARYNKRHKGEEAELYARQKKEYDEFTASLARRALCRKPDIFWHTARRDFID